MLSPLINIKKSIMNLSTDQRIIINSMLEFIFYSMATIFTLITLMLDVIWLENNINESSMTEIEQELALFIITLIFLRLAYLYQNQRNVHILIAGFFACMLIREFDVFLDLISHGSWVYIASSVAIIAVIATFRQPKLTMRQLAEYTRQPHYGFMMSGLICVLIFSRIFGMKLLWQNVLDDQYMRIVKNIAGEGLELFGYTLCFISTLLYRKYFIRSQQNQNEADKKRPSLETA